MNWRNYAFGAMVFVCLGVTIAMLNPDAEPSSDAFNGMLSCAVIAGVLGLLAVFAGTGSDMDDEDYL